MGAVGVGRPGRLRALRRTAAVRDPALRRLLLAWTAVMVGSWAAVVALSVVAYDAAGTPGAVLAALARTLPGALVGPLLGALVDRTSRPRCLLLAALACAGGSAGAAVASGALAAVVALVALVSLATLLYRTALSASLPTLARSAQELGAATVLVTVVKAFGVFAGPALAGLLLVAQGAELAFGASAGLFLAAALVHLRRRGAAPAADRRTRPGSATGTERLPVLQVLLPLVVAQTTLSGGLVVLYPALAVEALDTGLSAVGLLNAAYGLGGLLGSVLLFRLAGSRRLGVVVAGSLLLWSVPLLLVPAVPALPLVLLVLAVAGSANVLFDVSRATLLQRAVPGRALGRAFGRLETCVVLGYALGAVLSAPLEAVLGPAAAVGVLALPVAVGTAIAVPRLRRLDRDVQAPARQVALLARLTPFSLLPTVELERLALLLDPVVLPAATVVVAQGEPGSSWFVVGAGTLDVEVDGRRVAELVAGQSFGEVALLRGGVRTATVRARTPVELWSLDGAAFAAALQDDDGRAAAAAHDVVRAHLDRAAPHDPTRS